MVGYIGSIEKQTLTNNNYRQVLFTGKHEQLVVMCLQPGEDIGDEVHPHTDQFFRIEAGEATFIFNKDERHIVGEGEAVLVPAGTHHNVLNLSRTKPLRLYTIYAPPNHLPDTIHKTKADAKQH